MPPDVLSLVVAKDLVLDGFHMAIDEQAVVVLVMAPGNGEQFRRPCGAPARVFACVAVGRVVAAEGEGVAFRGFGVLGGFGHGDDAGRTGDMGFLHLVVAPVAVRMDMADVRAVAAGKPVAFRLVKHGGRTVEDAHIRDVGRIEDMVPVLATLFHGGRVQDVLVVLRIHAFGKAELADVARTGDTFGLRASFAESRHQHGRQNRDDRDDDQQFDQREMIVLFHDCLLLGLHFVSVCALTSADPPAFRALATDVARLHLLGMPIAETDGHHAAMANRAGGRPAAVLRHIP